MSPLPPPPPPSPRQRVLLPIHTADPDSPSTRFHPGKPTDAAPASRQLTSVLCFALVASFLSVAVFLLHAPRAYLLPTSAQRLREHLGQMSAAMSLPALPGSTQRSGFPPVPSGPTRIFAPSLRGATAAPHTNRTVFVFSELCTDQYNYVCKFWFHVRCTVLAAFPNVVALPPQGSNAINQWKAQARPGDIAIVSWRHGNHSRIPDNLKRLVDWRVELARVGDPRASVRLGVFHIANERVRAHWPWYLAADFVLRNYWTPQSSPHVQYIPLGGQVPAACPSERSSDSAGFALLPTDREQRADAERERDTGLGATDVGLRARPRRDACACEGVRLTDAAQRPLLWSFSGSLRRGRAVLVERLRGAADLRGSGHVHVAGKFGGDGWVGSGEKSDPKTGYLQTVMASQLVVCPCGNVMETHRIYEALNHGAVPVIEKCEGNDTAAFFPFRDLLVEGGPDGIVNFLRRFAQDKAAIATLQERVVRWWREYSTEIAVNVTHVVTEFVPARHRTTLG